MSETRSHADFSALSVLILVGGQGSRLKEEVSDRPKPMAEINGRPFLDMIIGHAFESGLRHFVLCTGHMGNVIEAYYAGISGPSRISFSHESRPLGTAGAVKNAQGLIESESFVVMNGDSLCRADLSEFYRFHQERNADVSIVVTKTKHSVDCGTVTVNGSGRIERYEEKTGKGSYVNAGIYCMNRRLLATIPFDIACSLERDIFPTLIRQNFYAFVSPFGFIDIGTPDRYRDAKRQFNAPI